MEVTNSGWQKAGNCGNNLGGGKQLAAYRDGVWVRAAMEKAGLLPPVADDRDGIFKVVFWRAAKGAERNVRGHVGCASEVR